MSGALSFVAVDGGVVIASVRMTRIAAGAGRALLLGPLAVRPAYKNIGIGRKLVAIALEAAAKAGAPARDAGRRRALLRPARLQEDPARADLDAAPGRSSTGCWRVEIAPGAVAALAGEVCHADQVKAMLREGVSIRLRRAGRAP